MERRIVTVLVVYVVTTWLSPGGTGTKPVVTKLSVSVVVVVGAQGSGLVAVLDDSG